jgi:2-(1,2-epoxy-1,2-dihydrophenyl)acetyl-CoA isomerase
VPDSHLLCKLRDGYAVLSLNRPESSNALTHALVADLRTRVEELDADPAVRAVVLTGAGRAFCAGADLNGPPSDAEDVLRRLYNPLITLMTGMATPVVAAVNGAAAGAGCSLALAADLRVASDRAHFSASFVKVGLVPDAGASWLLPRAVGSTRAAEIALLGRRVPAAQALEWGLVNEVVPPERLLDRACAIAAELASMPASVGTVRRLLLDGYGVDLATQLDAEASAQGAAHQHPDFAEAKQAFGEKRAPRFW